MLGTFRRRCGSAWARHLLPGFFASWFALITVLAFWAGRDAAMVVVLPSWSIVLVVAVIVTDKRARGRRVDWNQEAWLSLLDGCPSLGRPFRFRSMPAPGP
ncbi:MAG: hypothetical protein ACFCVK_04605 [Acidimicrobiales bacterium]